MARHSLESLGLLTLNSRIAFRFRPPPSFTSRRYGTGPPSLVRERRGPVKRTRKRVLSLFSSLVSLTGQWYETMVYCGKASQGCQSCRIRRIKVRLSLRLRANSMPQSGMLIVVYHLSTESLVLWFKLFSYDRLGIHYFLCNLIIQIHIQLACVSHNLNGY